jgi:hypothetical protein
VLWWKWKFLHKAYADIPKDKVFNLEIKFKSVQNMLKIFINASMLHGMFRIILTYSYAVHAYVFLHVYMYCILGPV